MKNNINISNQKEFEIKKKAIKESGFSDLILLSDFDRTLSKAFINGNEKVLSIVSIFRDEGFLSPDYPEKAKALFRKYHPIEIDNNISQAEKVIAMEKWWGSHSKLFIESKLSRRDLLKVAKSERIQLREKVSEIFNKLDEKNVPVIVLSSGNPGEEVIEEVLKVKNLNLKNVNIISNEYLWDRKGFAIDFKTPLIHVFNKSGNLIKQKDFYSEIKNRKNIILLGDGSGDVSMCEGLEYANVLKIGFLNYDIEENLENFKEIYDVILLNDAPMDFVLDLINEFK